MPSRVAVSGTEKVSFSGTFIWFLRNRDSGAWRHRLRVLSSQLAARLSRLLWILVVVPRLTPAIW